MKRVLLSVDWDYFCRERDEWDWGHRESSMFRSSPLWTHRAVSALTAGIDLREEMNPNRWARPVPGEFVQTLLDLWFDLTGAVVGAADSHAHAYELFTDLTMPRTASVQIVHFDAHHDLGYHGDPQTLECGNWLAALLRRRPKMTARVVYPPWKGLGEWTDFRWTKSQKALLGRVQESVFDEDVLRACAGRVISVFLARSGSWTPPWLDGSFTGLVSDFELATGATHRHMGPIPTVPREQIPWEEVVRMTGEMRSAMQAWSVRTA